MMEKGRENTKTTFFSLSFSFPGNLALRLPFPFRLLFLPLPSLPPGGRRGGWRSLFFGVGAMHKSRGEKKKKEKGGETAASRRKEGRESESWKKRYF